MKLLKTNEIIIKNSKFIGYLFSIKDEEEVNKIIENIKKENKKARHIPYAYKMDNIVKKSDDKEPSGTAGNPILNIINIKNLNNVIIVVVRYFGGIKLGAGGLIRAYSTIANNLTK
jgi:uncharacterized YigZ family protein